MGGRDDGGLGLLLIFCSLDALGRLPGGAIIAGPIILCLLIVGIVVLIVALADNSDYSPPPPAMSSPPPPPGGGGYLQGAKGEPHTPNDTSAEAFWTNAILLFFFFTLLTTPLCYYAPDYLFGSGFSRQRVVYVTAPNAAVPVVKGEPVANTQSAKPIEARPLLALPTSGGEHV